MRFRLLACIVLMLAAPSPLLAQIGQISGQVRYAENNQPAFNAIVSCDSYTSGFIGQQYADRNGRFLFSRLKLGQYTIRVRVPGFIEEKQDVDLSSAVTANLQIQLRADKSKSPVTRPGTINVNVPPPTAQAEFDQAVALIITGQKEDIERAIPHLQKAISIFPNFTEAELKLGTAYMDLGSWDKAEETLKTVIQIDPNAGNGYFALGEVYRREKKYDDAEKVLAEGLAIEARSAQAHFTLARVYWERASNMKDESQWRAPLEKSYQEVKQAIDLDPNFAAAHLLKGNLLFKVRRAEDALREFDEYLRLEPHGEFAPQTRELAEKIRKALSQQKKP